MDGASRRSVIPVLLACAVSLAAAQSKSETHQFTVSPGATVSIINDYGPITIRSAPGNQVSVTTIAHSSNVQVSASQQANQNRIELRSHHLHPGDDQVEYTVQVPQDASVVVRASSGPVKIEGVNGSIAIDSDTGSVEVRQSGNAAGARNAAVRVHTIDGPITIANLAGSKVEATSVSGEITLDGVTAPIVAANTNSAPIHFSGDLPAGSSCALSTHSADIDVTLPASASVDVTASSVNGQVEDGFPLQPDAHPGLTLAAGKSFAGHANSGAAKMSLRSFSGKISVRKK